MLGERSIIGGEEMPVRLSRHGPTQRRGAGRCPKGIVSVDDSFARLGGVSRAVDGGQAASEFLLTGHISGEVWLQRRQ